MSAKDRVSTATEATAASVRQIRPLDLPDDNMAPAGLRDRWRRNGSPFNGALGRIRETWLIPLGAAAVVAALAVSLVIVRNGDDVPGTAAGSVSGSGLGSGTGSAPAAGADAQAVEVIPRYFAIATEKIISHIHHGEIDVTVGDVRTGKTVATVALPSNDQSSTVGVSAASDDRTFVVGRRAIDGSIVFFLVHFDPGTKKATFRQLPVPALQPGVLLGFQVSPNGQQLAVLSVRGDGTTLRIYSLTTGATLRTWNAGAWKFQGNGVLQANISWTADNREVGFSTGTSPLGGPLVERVISAAAPSGDLAAASKVVLTAPGNCTSLLLTPDGGTVVCATTVNYPPRASSAGCGSDKPMFVNYSAATGKRLGIAYRYTGTCDSASYTVLWADNSARHVIGESQVEGNGQSLLGSSRWGVVADGTFTKLPVPGFNQSSSQPAW